MVVTYSVPNNFFETTTFGFILVVLILGIIFPLCLIWFSKNLFRTQSCQECGKNIKVFFLRKRTGMLCQKCGTKKELN